MSDAINTLNSKPPVYVIIMTPPTVTNQDFRINWLTSITIRHDSKTQELQRTRQPQIDITRQYRPRLSVLADHVRPDLAWGPPSRPVLLPAWSFPKGVGVIYLPGWGDGAGGHLPTAKGRWWGGGGQVIYLSGYGHPS